MSMADRDGVIWCDGKMVPWRDANVHVLTHTLHYGLGVFEGIRAYQTKQGPAIFRLQEHTDRLFNSAHIFMMKMPYDKMTMMQAQRDVVKENNLDSGYIRPIVYYGSEAMGLFSQNIVSACRYCSVAMGHLSGRGELGKRYPCQNFIVYPTSCQHQYVSR